MEFDLDLGLYLKNLVAFTTGQSRFLTVGRLRLDALQAGREESCRGMEFAINFIKNNVGSDSPALLASPFILIASPITGTSGITPCLLTSLTACATRR